jgi:hypothetical protein
VVERVRPIKPLLPAAKGRQESSIGADRAKFISSAPLLAGEDAADLNEFSQQVNAAAKPVDIFDQIWVRDFVDYDRGASLVRRVKAKCFNDAAQNLLKNEILHCTRKEAEDIEADWSQDEFEADPEEQAANELARRWIAGDESAKNEMRKIFAKAGRDVEEVIADVTVMAFQNTMKDVEAFDRMIMIAESRRNAAVREMDRHRAMLSLQSRRTSEQIHDAEFKVIEDKG